MNQHKLKQFIGDSEMQIAVKYFLLDFFMKKRGNDVHMKAGQMLAIDYLQDGWRELEQLKTSEPKRISDTSHI